MAPKDLLPKPKAKAKIPMPSWTPTYRKFEWLQETEIVTRWPASLISVLTEGVETFVDASGVVYYRICVAVEPYNPYQQFQ